MNHDREKVRILGRDEIHDGFNRLTRLRFQVRIPGGGWAAETEREVLERQNAACLLPYDPIRDQVVLVRQFRAGAYLGAQDPYQPEPPAGLYLPGEDPEHVARREAWEEAGLEVTACEPMMTFVVTPGVSTEVAHVWCGRVSAPADGGVFGEQHEGEVTQVMVLDTDDALDRLARGELTFSLTVISLQWLALNRDRLRALWR